MANKTFQAFVEDSWVDMPEEDGLFQRVEEAGIPIRVLWSNGSFHVIKNKKKAPKKEQGGSAAWARKAEAKAEPKPKAKAKPKAEPKPKAKAKAKTKPNIFDEYGPMVASS